MRKNLLARLVSCALTASITLAGCSQPAPQPTAEPDVTPQITVQINPPATPGPSPTPRPLVNPILVDRAPVQGEELPVDKPIELIFDQPMDRRSVERALSVQTADGVAVTGKLEWTSDNRALFKPSQDWARATRYTVSLSTDAKSAKGLALARPESFTVNTVGALAVAQTIPAAGAQDVTADATITVLFNRPVVPLTTLDEQANLPAPVTFNPPVAGRGQWLNTSIYVFQPSQPLQAGATYEGRVAAGLRDTTGALLESDYVWTFSVAAPVVKFIAPSDGAKNIGLRQPISVTFSQKMDRASAEAAFVIEPPVRGSFRWADEPPPEPSPQPFEPASQPAGAPPLPRSFGEVMAFVPDEDYQRGQTYTVRVKAGARAAAGSGATAVETTTTFQAVPLPTVVKTRPADGQDRAPATDGFAIRFSAPMSVPTVIANLAFDPPITLTGVYSYYDEFSNEFALYVNLKPSTNYRVRIGGDATDIYGVKIGRDTEVRFSTGPLPPLVIVQSDGLVGTYNAAQPTQLFVLYRNVTRLDFELASLTPQQFYDLTGAVNSYENLRAFKPGADQMVHRWSVMTTAGLNESDNYKVSLSEGGGALPTGIYLLTVSAPELVALDRDFQPIRHILIVTNVHIGLKRGDREGLAWVTNLNTGASLSGVLVSFRDNTFAEIASATTGGGEEAGQAFVTFPERYRPYHTLYALVGEPGGPFGVAWSEMSFGINIYDFNLPGRYQAEPFFAYLYTDRPVYRPGQMVFYKGIVRRDDDARYTVPTDVTQVNLTIFNGQGQQVVSTTVPLDANGGFNGQFALDNGAPTGQYFIQICVPRLNRGQDEPPCSYYGVSFLVAAYRVPEFEVTAATDKTDYLDGETINATFDAKYFFGGNVAGAQVRWSLLATDYFFDRYTGAGSYTFGDFDFSPRSIFGFNEPIASGEGVTDAQGRFTLSLPADLSKRKTSARFTLEASVTDVNDQSVSARVSVVVHKGAFYFGIAPRGYVFNAGDEVTVDVISVGWDGQPMPNKPVVVSFNRRQWFTTQEQDPYGGLYYSSVPSDTEVFSITITTDADGKALAGFRPQEGGEYHIVAAGPAGTEPAVAAGTSVYVSSAGEYVAWRVENNDRIELKADKRSYQVGETARVLVPSPFQGATTALLTIERGGFLQRKTITLRSNSDVLDIPIEPSFAPNVYVSVLIVQGVSSDNPVPAYRLGYTQFEVDPAQFALNIEITPDRAQYAPRDTATYDIRVTDAAGNPVQAELSLALVDKAVLSLADPNVEPILDAFYGRRPLSVRTSSTLSVNVDRITSRLLSAEAKGGGGGGEALADVQFTRRNFKDTAYWNAVVQTGADGRARVQIILPDNLTTWRMTARAITPDTRVGEATNEVVSTKPLLVRPVTPRFFVAGDTVTIGAVVNNNTAADLDVQVALASTGLTLIGGDAIQQVNVKAGSTTRVDWTVTVQEPATGAVASSEITMTVAGGGLQDSAQPGLLGAPNGIPILRYSAPETVGTAGDLGEPGRKLELIALPPRLDTGRGDLTVRVDTGLGVAAAKGVQALEAYPYESAEWTASRIIVNLALVQAGVTAAYDAAAALQRLYGQQHSDGGWGWWISSPSDPMVSAHVVWAMARAQQAGFPVDEGALNRALNYLSEQLKPPSALADATAANRQAYILFVQTEAGRGDSGRLGALYENRAKLSHYGRALLAMALDRINPGDSRIKTLLADIQAAAIPSATGVSWQERERDWANWSSDTRSTGIVLAALARLDPRSAFAPNAVRWLMAARTGSGWSTTQETAWAIVAFAEWIRATDERRSAFDWRVTLNDQSLLRGQANPQGESAEAVVAVANLLRTQANELAFERGAGEGRLYYTAHLRAYLPADAAPAINRGIVIARKYELADCAPAPDKPCPAINGAKIGQNVRVRLTIVAPSELYYLRITDPLPSGAEAVDTSLKTSQTLNLGDEPVIPIFGGKGGWGWWYFNHREIYDDRVAVFASYLPAGTYEYTYVIRPSIAGQFKVMPASAEQTYFPEVFGRSDGAAFTIER
ncbi:MAG: Ig-like domain-containing protein [Anaerolineae bacterium]|nr:Ig-like domain-containing protein [Candidatus Roseilinea sp.]MDW8450971.1 Ig-like domain-containing protein [Anaerolineae bacterium]